MIIHLKLHAPKEKNQVCGNVSLGEHKTKDITYKLKNWLVLE
jgi:hypothetical protein